MCSPKCAKVVIIIINVFFIALGLALLILGILVVVNENLINKEIFPALQSISLGASNLGDLAKGLAITLIVFGGFVLLLSLLGACGACCDIKACLCVYLTIVAILFIGKVVIVILWIVMKANIENTLKSEMLTGLKKFSQDSLTGDELSKGWNYLQLSFQCCGINAVTTATNDFDGSTWQAGSPSTDIPLSCCPGVSASSYASGSATNAACPSAKNTNPVGQYSQGCYDAIKDFVNKYSVAFIVVGVLILVIEVMAVILACYLCKKGGKDQVV